MNKSGSLQQLEKLPHTKPHHTYNRLASLASDAICLFIPKKTHFLFEKMDTVKEKQNWSFSYHFSSFFRIFLKLTGKIWKSFFTTFTWRSNRRYVDYEVMEQKCSCCSVSGEFHHKIVSSSFRIFWSVAIRNYHKSRWI